MRIASSSCFWRVSASIQQVQPKPARMARRTPRTTRGAMRAYSLEVKTERKLSATFRMPVCLPSSAKFVATPRSERAAPKAWSVSTSPCSRRLGPAGAGLPEASGTRPWPNAFSRSTATLSSACDSCPSVGLVSACWKTRPRRKSAWPWGGGSSAARPSNSAWFSRPSPSLSSTVSSSCGSSMAWAALPPAPPPAAPGCCRSAERRRRAFSSCAMRPATTSSSARSRQPSRGLVSAWS
mmetsp:Transcript_115615/g.359199  ORF Transcript_115615/g.359199 Transcript_115615/m.359199 type:complete len:238 (-) Transcript_115615:1025-1738(-)